VIVEIVCVYQSLNCEKYNAGYPYPALTLKQQLLNNNNLLHE